MRFAAAILLACCLCGCSSPMAPHGIPNLSQVAPGIWRGGQPQNQSSWRYLRDDCGITDVVKLNEDCEGSDAAAEALGMRVHRFPINFVDQTVGEPPKAVLWAAVDVLETNTGAVFVHCSHGQDRTGLVVAMYRWDTGMMRSRAEAEMMRMGFHPQLRGLYWAWQDYTLIDRVLDGTKKASQ